MVRHGAGALGSLLLLSVAGLGCDAGKSSPSTNSAPHAVIESPEEGKTFATGESISFSGLVGDAEQTARTLTVIWSSDVDGVVQEGATADDDGTTNMVTNVLSLGPHTIVLEAVDSSAERGEDTVHILIIDPEEVPVVQVRNPQDNDVLSADEELTLSATVSDSVDGPTSLLVTFDAVPDVTSEPIGLCDGYANDLGMVNCTADLDVGVYTVVASVQDSDGNLGQDVVDNVEVKDPDDMDDDDDGFTENEDDCDDADATVYPGAEELVNEIDDDCDGTIDEGSLAYDDDGDGFSEIEGDCDDTDDAVYPGADERPNGIDDDCDGDTDEGTDDIDDDGDGISDLDGDCDDDDASIYPGAPEIMDGIDNDCDDLVDEGTDAYDDDGDGFSDFDGDCDDSDDAIHPDATEIRDEIDNDCDGDIDEGTSAYDDDGDCYCEEDPCMGSVEEDCTSLYDGDCDDDNADVYPYAGEVCDDEDIDEDCDGMADDDDTYASGRTQWFYDLDGDGYGDSSSFLYRCEAPAGYVSNNDDCDDWCSSCHPGATETCDGQDNDCDSSTDEEGASGCTNYFLDEDRDGWGHGTEWKCLCEVGDVPYYDADDSRDCCDEDADTHPGVTDWAEGLNACGSPDINCDGVDETRFNDLGSCSFGVTGCDNDPGWYPDLGVPDCASSSWWTECSSWPGCNVETEEVRLQSCR